MTRTNEKLAEKIAKETPVVDTRPQWEIDREERELQRNNAAHFLLEYQIEALKFAMKIIQEADFECHESYELGVDTMKGIDRAEWKLHMAFPELHDSVHNDRMEN